MVRAVEGIDGLAEQEGPCVAVVDSPSVVESDRKLKDDARIVSDAA
jgi:hypothetical protein